ncbi:hypothetical protein FSB78_16635 [Sphingomonas ginsenosidivorax]|uniref:Nucleotidyltransferase family protein n=1 Tax=Sphingomonas ginsenosidivorax TaxID=862135 RepID=A0A5C6UJF2_9SPHN|nr:hypothetical protein [Sphingomonas ginsenosidivorax]TXC72391.1 hypothetical protein FSB78_16635 [Sphingomonas ginsenosidivorax]
MTPYRPEFETALRVFARASKLLIAQGYEAPILVGGAAVEIFTASAIATGDFDVVTARQGAFEAALRSLGFVKPSGPGMATRGWVHPDLMLSFEVVSTRLLDGLADRKRVLVLDFGTEGTASIISVEDMIADRMGQFASGTAPEMRGQARAMLVLHTDIDRAYLAHRIIEETAGDYRIEDVEGDPL